MARREGACNGVLRSHRGRFESHNGQKGQMLISCTYELTWPRSNKKVYKCLPTRRHNLELCTKLRLLAVHRRYSVTSLISMLMDLNISGNHTCFGIL